MVYAFGLGVCVCVLFNFNKKWQKHFSFIGHYQDHKSVNIVAEMEVGNVSNNMDSYLPRLI